MAHHETRLAAETLSSEITATRTAFATLGRLIRIVKDKVATLLTARGPFASARTGETPDIFDDLYYPNVKAARH